MMAFGITEAGDAGLDFSWTKKLKSGNIIITKHLTEKNTHLISELVKNNEKIILHVTCTGYGGTVIEPNVPTPEEVHEGTKKLIESGFPAKQIVLRTDPIIPTNRGIARVKSIWTLFSDLGIERCRYSVIDMYPHVAKRFLEELGKVPFESFQAPAPMMEAVRKAVLESGLYHFESCGENLPKPCGCISQKDYEILGLKFQDQAGGYQRPVCMCCAGKTELLGNKKQCPSGCLYCYWKSQ